MAGITYDASVDTIKGEDLELYVNDGTTDLILAFAKTCGINQTSETIDTTSKMSGSWKESTPGLLGWSISTECLATNKTGTLSYDKLSDLMISRLPVSLKVATPSTDWAAGTSFRTGKAIITALDLKTDQGTLCTCSITLQGTGALAKPVVTP